MHGGAPQLPEATRKSALSSPVLQLWERPHDVVMHFMDRDTVPEMDGTCSDVPARKKEIHIFGQEGLGSFHQILLS